MFATILMSVIFSKPLLLFSERNIIVGGTEIESVCTQLNFCSARKDEIINGNVFDEEINLDHFSHIVDSTDKKIFDLRGNSTLPKKTELTEMMMKLFRLFLLFEEQKQDN